LSDAGFKISNQRKKITIEFMKILHPKRYPSFEKKEDRINK